MAETSERSEPNRAKITKKAVDALAPGSVLWDIEVSGFGIRCRDGGTKTYVVQYRAGSGRGAPLRKYTIGRHGSPWTPDTPRKEARRVLGRVAAGDDPAASERAQEGWHGGATVRRLPCRARRGQAEGRARQTNTGG